MNSDQARPVKKYDLEDRTLQFGKDIVDLCNCLPKNQINFKFIDQIIRSATSVGSNYREANEALGKKDFYMKLKISRKEAKETNYWLDLILYNNRGLGYKMQPLITESQEFIKIFSAIINKYHA